LTIWDTDQLRRIFMLLFALAALMSLVQIVAAASPGT
jgi:hypothetical protein